MATANFTVYEPAVSAVLQPATRKLLRFTTAGSVDDGKSTLIGRLLYDSQAVYEDQLASVRASRINRSSGAIDFSLLTDGLRAEREQGITIDVAYRYFSTPRRKFIIADTPGHEQYTRNMATGASTADAAVILIDATKGLLPQSRRHAYIASLLGIRHVIVAINKMDLVRYSRDVFERIAQDFQKLAAELEFENVYPLPVSAVEGDNLVRRSERMPWFQGPALLEYLEDLPVDDEANRDDPVRFPVQYVIRPDSSFRGFAGELASGTLQRGDSVVVFPSGRKTRIKSIVTWQRELEEARAGDAITITLEDEVDVSRGDLLTGEEKRPSVSRAFQATLVWMHSDPLDRGAYYLLKHASRTGRCRVRELLHRVDINTLSHVPATTLNMNDISSVQIETTSPLFFDSYRRIRHLGSFILIDPVSNATVAAGMIESSCGLAEEQLLSRAIVNSGAITAAKRRQLFGHEVAGIWITGSARIAELVEHSLLEQGWRVHLLGENFSREEQRGAVKALRDAGMVVLFSDSTGADHAREEARAQFNPDAFFIFDERQEPEAEAASTIVGALRAWRDTSDFEKDNRL
jgi:sulfate adenylyltransferase large subunit